jgi:glycosyltransferase involved in cell wall biosynthesis
MRVGLYLADLRRSKNDSHGTINYALGLLHALPQALESGDQLFVLANPEIAAELGPRQDWRLELVPVPGTVTRRLWTDHLLSQQWARRAHLDVLHFPKGHVPIWRPRRPAVVGTIHDDIAVQYARGALGAVDNRLKRWYFGQAVVHAARHADRVLTVSEFSAGRIRALSSRSPERVTVTFEGSALPDRPFVPATERDQALVLFGSTVPHKRTTQTLNWVLRYLAERRSPITAVVVGPLPAAFEGNPAVRRVSGVLSNEQVAETLGRARALVFGSVYEGFGLPPVEAYLLGVPAVYAETTAVSEIMDGFPGGFRPDDYRAFAAALDRILALTDGELRAAQAEMNRRYRWDEVARRTVDVYRSVSFNA